MLEWFDDWLKLHLELNPHAKLPPRNAAFEKYYRLWESLFRSEGITNRSDADAASERIALTAVRFPRDHLPTLVRYATEARRVRQGTAGGTPRHDTSTREGAEAASKGCERCGGDGLVSVWHPRPDPANKVPEAVAAYCVCAMGRWIKGRHDATCPEVRRRMIDLDDVINGRVAWLAERPRSEEPAR